MTGKIKSLVPSAITFTALACALSAPLTAAARSGETFELASGGRARAVIVAESGTNGYAYAANELAKYLGKITGAAFMVADRPVKGYKTIRV